MAFRGYNVVNAYTDNYADLKVFPGPGSSSVGAPVVTAQADGEMDQQWRLFPVLPSGNLYTLQNVKTGTFASVPSVATGSGNAVAGEDVVSATLAMTWEVDPFDTSSNTFTVKVPYSNLFWTGRDKGGPVKLEAKSTKPSELKNQAWVFVTVLS